MRLIDIDKHFEINEAFYRADIEMPLHRVKIALENSPTVEAIPIEWIKNYLKTSPKMWQGYHDEELVQEMLEDWEKSKDARRQD